ncbi:hypothetical protein PR048_016192 [Dryococelus australis]|uniref:Uncharacterized protein n=1 Tax=Dryococelus australis TaxID=614101 RepID=A0ABQ9HJG8_9NEOP|nr:hypothetical protein PR048_016192 [Dryococelus australis]
MRKREVAKRLRNSGKSYIGNRGIVKPARQLRPFNHYCRYKCNETISEQERQTLLTEYWALGSWNLPTAFGTNIDTVHHKFLEPEHTFNECDQDFGLIEEKRKHNEMHVRAHITLQPLYDEPIKIKHAKWKNLQDLKMHIPPIHHSFFDHLVYEPVPSETRTQRRHGQKSGRREDETHVDDTLARAHIQEITAEEEADGNSGEAESADEVVLFDEASDILDSDNE